MAPIPPDVTSPAISSSNGDPAWLPWQAPVDPDARVRLERGLNKAGITDAKDLAAFIDSSQVCQVDPEGNLLLRRAEGSTATIPLRAINISPSKRLPPSIYTTLFHEGSWHREPDEFYKPQNVAEREFLATLFAGRKTEQVLASCGEGISIHPIVEGNRSPEASDILVVCHGRRDENTPANNQECADPFDPKKVKECLRVSQDHPTNFDLLDPCIPDGRKDPMTRTLTIGGREMTILTGYEESGWLKWALYVGGGLAVAGGTAIAFLVLGEEPSSSGNGTSGGPGPGPGPGPLPDPGPQPQPPATGSDSGVGRRGGRGR